MYEQNASVECRWKRKSQSHGLVRLQGSRAFRFQSVFANNTGHVVSVHKQLRGKTSGRSIFGRNYLASLLTNINNVAGGYSLRVRSVVVGKILVCRLTASLRCINEINAVWLVPGDIPCYGQAVNRAQVGGITHKVCNVPGGSIKLYFVAEAAFSNNDF